MSRPASSGDSSPSVTDTAIRLRQYKNKALDSEETRRRREEYSVQLRKQRRDEHICKRRTGSSQSLRYDSTSSDGGGDGMDSTGGGGDSASNLSAGQSRDSNVDLEEAGAKIGHKNMGMSSQDSDDITGIDEVVKNNLLSLDLDIRMKTLYHVRRLLSREPDPPIESVLENGLIPILIEFLKQDSKPELQFESAWAITNILSGSQDQTERVVEHGVIPELIRLINSSYSGVREQAIWALGNLAGDCPSCRDRLLAQGAMDPLLVVIQEAEAAPSGTQVSFIRNAVWCLSNLCRGKAPPPDFQVVSRALPLLARLLFSDDGDLLTDVCWSIGYLADGPDDHIQVVVESGVVRGLVRLFIHPKISVVCAALRAIGNIVTGDDLQTQVVISCGVLPGLGHLLSTCKGEAIRKEVCWVISNITAGNKKQIQAVIDADLMPLVVEVLSQGQFKTRKEAAWVVSNAASGGTTDQVDYLTSQGCLPPLCRLTTTLDTQVVLVALAGIENMLRVGQAIASKRGLAHNPVAEKLEECGGLDHIESLQSHENREVYQMVYNMIDRYFLHENVDSDSLHLSHHQASSAVPSQQPLDLSTSPSITTGTSMQTHHSPEPMVIPGVAESALQFNFQEQNVPSEGFSF